MGSAPLAFGTEGNKLRRNRVLLDVIGFMMRNPCTRRPALGVAFPLHLEATGGFIINLPMAHPILAFEPAFRLQLAVEMIILGWP
jgi:hypothetical protein